MGTCQVCGANVAVTSAADPRAIQRHGWLREVPGSLPCAGTGYPPLEDSAERAHAMQAWLRAQLVDMRARLASGEEPVRLAGMDGAQALRAQFAGDVAAIAAARRRALRATRERIDAADRRLAIIEDILLTRATMTVGSRQQRGTHRINSVFRRKRDGLMYIVREFCAARTLHGGRHAMPSYICVGVESGKPRRLSANEVTRGLAAWHGNTIAAAGDGDDTHAEA